MRDALGEISLCHLNTFVGRHTERVKITCAALAAFLRWTSGRQSATTRHLRKAAEGHAAPGRWKEGAEANAAQDDADVVFVPEFAKVEAKQYSPLPVASRLEKLHDVVRLLLRA